MLRFSYGCLILLSFTFTLVFCPLVSADSEISWNTFLGSSSIDEGYSVATDNSGNLYVTGISDAGWGSPINPHPGGEDAFVAKLDSSGVLQWHTFLGSSSVAPSSGAFVTVDSSGNIYVTGHSSTGWGSPINPHAGFDDAFVVKLDSSGVLQWHTFLGSDEGDWGLAVVTDGSGFLYIAGNANTGWGSPINPHSEVEWVGGDVFVAKLDSSGVLKWHTFLGSRGLDWPHSVAVDDSGNLYATGRSDAGWGSPINPHASTEGMADVFVAKLDSNGVLQWNTFLGSSSIDEGYSVATDSSGNIYVTGESWLGWGSPINAYAGSRDAFVAKLDGSGLLQWHTFLGSSSGDIGHSIAVDGGGNLYVAGESYAAGWGLPINPHAGSDDAFVAKLDSSGVLQWHTFLGSGWSDYGYAIAAAANGNIYITGKSEVSWASPIDPHAGAGGIPDVFVAKIYDLDIDDDGWPNDTDGCPYDLNKSDPGTCGCGVADTDSDSDGTLDCNDECPLDPEKTLPGLCGCGVSDVDANGNGTADCLDQVALAEIIATSSNGIRYWDAAASEWTQMTSSTPTGDIAAGDFTGDGRADVASTWNSGLWYQDGDTLAWTKITGTAPVSLTAGDVTGDGRSEIIGTWSSGIWYWDVATSKWTKMTASTPTGDIAAGDFTGDGKADVASIWGSGLWYQDGAALDWIKISGTAPVSVTAGDVTGDGRSEIIGSWSSGIWYWDVAASKWTKMTASTPTGDIAAGDFTGDGKAEVASCWSSGLWYQDGATFDWTKVSNTAPIHLTAGDVTGP